MCYMLFAFQAKLHKIKDMWQTATISMWQLALIHYWTQEGEREFPVSHLSFDFLKHSDWDLYRKKNEKQLTEAKVFA